MSTRYHVAPAPGMSDDEGTTYFAVSGPDVDVFARQYEMAAAIQRALNRPALTPQERSAVRWALGIVLAGERDTTLAQDGAMRRALEKLS